uniref:Ig-like domain-containing protein n=1 Tax=Oncorhynchus mykiss TaxID=8022 RepID=A0A8C7UPE8_ONCMY
IDKVSCFCALLLEVRYWLCTQAGAYGVSTVSKVSVKTGNYITIPCRYDQRYIQYVKYWCQGDYWNSCSALVCTDKPKISGTVSISDDVTRRIFSVNMTDLQPEDSGYYWCAVETAGRDQNAYLHLSVTTGTPELYVDQQEVSGVEGGSVTVRCYYSNTVVKKWLWCKMDYWNSCSALVRTDQPKISGTVSISDDVTRRIFSVNMTDLQPEDSGYYWCAVETAGQDQNAYLHLSVTTGYHSIVTFICLTPQKKSSQTQRSTMM